jgi:hypothetical protein
VNPMLMAVMMVLAVLASCSRSGGSSSSGPGAGGPASTVGALHKVDGPPIDRLSLDQINRIDQTCFLHRDLDDPRVPYTSSYCEKLDQERNRRAMLTPGQRTVIVGGQPVKQLQ